MLEKLAASFMESIRSEDDAVSRLREHPEFPERDFLVALFRQIAEIDSAYTPDELTRAAVLIRGAAPSDTLIRRLTDKYIRRTIPNWHWPMLHDTPRNDAYQKAINKSISGKSMVLEIGTGSGFLATMAAKAGARHVYTCEANRELADIAEENIRRADLSDRITVIRKWAEDLQLGSDLPERCNVLVHEMMSGDLVGEGILQVLDSIGPRLLEPDALHLPNRLYAQIQGIRNNYPLSFHEFHQHDDIDLSAVNTLAPAVSLIYPFADVSPVGRPRRIIEYSVVDNRLALAETPTIPLSEFLTDDMTGFVQWIGFSFPNGTSYENGPGQPSHWEWRFYPLPGDSTDHEGKSIVADVVDGELFVYVADDAQALPRSALGSISRAGRSRR